MKALIEVVVTHRIRVDGIQSQADAEEIREAFQDRIDAGFPEIVVVINGIEVTYYPEKTISSGVPFVELNW